MLDRRYFIGALVFFALSVLIFSFGIPPTFIVIALGYSDSIIGTFLIFNGMGILSFIIALIIRVQGMK